MKSKAKEIPFIPKEAIKSNLGGPKKIPFLTPQWFGLHLVQLSKAAKNYRNSPSKVTGNQPQAFSFLLSADKY